MFTFGREHEKKCAASYFRPSADPGALLALIDAVHDLAEGRVDVDHVHALLVECVVTGGVRTWEGAGYWLGKAQEDFPALTAAWTELAAHPQAEVRWRLACLLDRVPAAQRATLTAQLLADRSARVRDRVVGAT
jgi:hypothetical protein